MTLFDWGGGERREMYLLHGLNAAALESLRFVGKVDMSSPVMILNVFIVPSSPAVRKADPNRLVATEHIPPLCTTLCLNNDWASTSQI